MPTPAAQTAAAANIPLTLGLTDLVAWQMTSEGTLAEAVPPPPDEPGCGVKVAGRAGLLEEALVPGEPLPVAVGGAVPAAAGLTLAGALLAEESRARKPLIVGCWWIARPSVGVVAVIAIAFCQAAPDDV